MRFEDNNKCMKKIKFVGLAARLGASASFYSALEW
jgi:hypothetical protein